MKLITDIEVAGVYSVAMMRFQPTISLEQYRDACRAVMAAKPKRPQRRPWKEAIVLTVASFVLVVALQIPVARIVSFTILALLLLFSVICKPLSKWSQERCLRKIYCEEQEKLNGQVLTIDEAGISCDQIDGQATAYYRWPGFTKRMDRPDEFLFLPSPNSFVRIPKERLELSDRELIWQWSSMVPTAGGR